MTLASFGVLLLAVALAATGQLLLKHGMNLATDRSNANGQSLIISAATTVWVWCGLVVFGISAIAWLATLSRVPLNVAYPFNAVGFLVILVASALLLHERTNLWTWLGTVLVVGGLVVVVTLGAGHSS